GVPPPADQRQLDRSHDSDGALKEVRLSSLTRAQIRLPVDGTRWGCMVGHRGPIRLLSPIRTMPLPAPASPTAALAACALGPSPLRPRESSRTAGRSPTTA